MSVTTSAPARSGVAHRGALLGAVCLVQLLVVLDVSLLNIALPTIDRGLGFSATSLTWVVNAYVLALGGLLLLGGRLADLVGQRRAVVAGLVLFGLTSLLGAVAQEPWQLVAARAGQGVAGAVIAPASLTIIMTAFAEGPARQRAITVWAMVGAGGAALGVLGGGVLTDAFGWRSVLLVNVPILLGALWLTVRSVPAAAASGRLRDLDVVGALAVTAAAGLVVYGLLEAPARGWTDGLTLACLVGGLLVAGLFVAWERAVAVRPLVPLDVFRSRGVWVADVVVLAIGAATVAGFYFASLFLQNVLGYSPMRAGAAFLPFCLGTMIGSFGSIALTRRIGTRATLVGGMLLGAVGMLLFGLMDAETSFWTGFAPPSIIASVWSAASSTPAASSAAASASRC